MTNLLAAATAAAVAVDDCTAFTIAGECKIIAALGADEYIYVYEEYPDGTYKAAINKAGLSIVLSQDQPSIIFAGYGNYKIAKTATAVAINVGFAD